MWKKKQDDRGKNSDRRPKLHWDKASMGSTERGLKKKWEISNWPEMEH